MKPVCHVVAGPNGSGKSTFALDYLPEFASSIESVNPDLMAQGLSPTDITLSALKAGEWRLKNLLAQFAAEGQTVTPDVWDRLEADRRQTLADDLEWIERGRASSTANA